MREVPRVPRRYAEVRGASAATVAKYLPRNYRVDGVRWDDTYAGQTVRVCHPTVFISGTDVAGWTLSEYVIPRLGSGMISAREFEGPNWPGAS